jgi:hypothetical protein
MRSGPDGFEIQILPLVRTRRGRRRAAAAAALLLAASLAAAARLGQAWESGGRRGFADLPLSLLIVLSVAVGVSTPLAVIGLAALVFAEESVHVGPESVTIRRSAFEHARVRNIPRSEIECWRQTYLPLSPWWTWAVVRLAARSGGRLEAVAAAAGPKEKRQIARALARATDRPIVTDGQALALAGWRSWGNRGGRAGAG